MFVVRTSCTWFLLLLYDGKKFRHRIMTTLGILRTISINVNRARNMVCIVVKRHNSLGLHTDLLDPK